MMKFILAELSLNILMLLILAGLTGTGSIKDSSMVWLLDMHTYMKNVIAAKNTRFIIQSVRNNESDKKTSIDKFN